MSRYLFCWKLFTGWDYTIGNSETSGNICMANVIKFRVRMIGKILVHEFVLQEAIAEFNVNQGRGCQ